MYKLDLWEFATIIIMDSLIPRISICPSVRRRERWRFPSWETAPSEAAANCDKAFPLNQRRQTSSFASGAFGAFRAFANNFRKHDASFYFNYHSLGAQFTRRPCSVYSTHASVYLRIFKLNVDFDLNLEC